MCTETTEVGQEFTHKTEGQCGRNYPSRGRNYVIYVTLALYIFVPRLNYFANTVTCTY
jgi:hypothetical protein